MHTKDCPACTLLQALIYLDMGDLSKALAQGQAALAIRQKVLSGEHPDLAHSLTGKDVCCVNVSRRVAVRSSPCAHVPVSLVALCLRTPACKTASLCHTV